MSNLFVRFTTHVSVGNISDDHCNTIGPIPYDTQPNPYIWHLGKVYLGGNLRVRHQSLPRSFKSNWKVYYAGVYRYNTPNLLCADFDHYWYRFNEDQLTGTYSLHRNQGRVVPSPPIPVTLEQIEGSFGPPPWKPHENSRVYGWLLPR